jgi:cytoskeletal protein CcmA (bactofilin family)
MSWFKNPAGEPGDASPTDPFREAAVPPRPPVARTTPPLDAPSAPRHELRAELRLPHPAPSKPAAAAPVAATAPAAPVAPVEAKPRGSVLGPTLRFKGELRADEDLVVQGHVEGSIHHTQTLIIGVDGFVKGDTRARSITIEGTVEGDLYALESIAVRATAKVQGNLFAPRVSLADGASFNGRIDMASATKAAKSIAEHGSSLTLDDKAANALLTGS